MKKAGIIVALAHRAAQTVIQPGITTKKISQITKQRNAKVEDYLNRGQEVEVKIISLNKDEKKLGLALTELMEAKETAEDAE